MLCNLQIFSGCVCHLEQLHAQSPFLFPIVFVLILFLFSIFAQYLLFFHPRLFRYVLLHLGRAARSKQLLFVVLAAGLWCFTAGCHVKSALFPQCNPLSNRSVLNNGRKHKTVVFSQSNALRKYARRTYLLLLAIGCRADCSGERRTSPFNGVERSLSRAVVIKTKSLPVSATTFLTALSFVHRARWKKHKHYPALSASRQTSYKIYRSSLSAAADGLGDGSGERRTSPVNGIEKIAQSCRSPKD